MIRNNNYFREDKREVFSKKNIQEIYGAHIRLVDGNRIEMQI